MSTRRIAVGADPIGIKMVTFGIGPDPTDGALDVVHARKDCAIQSIIDRRGNVTVTRIVEGRADEISGAFITAHPTAAMDENHHRPRRLGSLLRPCHIECPGFIAFAIGDIQFNLDALRNACADLFVGRVLPIAISVVVLIQPFRQLIEFFAVKLSVFISIVSVEKSLHQPGRFFP